MFGTTHIPGEFFLPQLILSVNILRDMSKCFYLYDSVLTTNICYYKSTASQPDNREKHFCFSFRFVYVYVLVYGYVYVWCVFIIGKSHLSSFVATYVSFEISRVDNQDDYQMTKKLVVYIGWVHWKNKWFKFQEEKKQEWRILSQYSEAYVIWIWNYLLMIFSS